MLEKEKLGRVTSNSIEYYPRVGISWYLQSMGLAPSGKYASCFTIKVENKIISEDYSMRITTISQEFFPNALSVKSIPLLTQTSDMWYESLYANYNAGKFDTFENGFILAGLTSTYSFGASSPNFVHRWNKNVPCSFVDSVYTGSAPLTWVVWDGNDITTINENIGVIQDSEWVGGIG